MANHCGNPLLDRGGNSTAVYATGIGRRNEIGHRWWHWRVTLSPPPELRSNLYRIYPVCVESKDWDTSRENYGKFIARAIIIVEFGEYFKAVFRIGKKDTLSRQTGYVRWYKMSFVIFLCIRQAKACQCPIPQQLLLS
jgi:hypothetical protein